MASYDFSNSNDYALSGYYACLGHGSGFAGIGGDQQIAFCTHSGEVRCTHSVGPTSLLSMFGRLGIGKK